MDDDDNDDNDDDDDVDTTTTNTTSPKKNNVYHFYSRHSIGDWPNQQHVSWQLKKATAGAYPQQQQIITTHNYQYDGWGSW